MALAFMAVKKFADRNKVKLGQFDLDKPNTLTGIPTVFTYAESEVAELMGVSVKTLKSKDKDTGQSFSQGVYSKLITRLVISNDKDTWWVASLISEAEFRNGVLTLGVTRRQAERMLNYGLSSNNFGMIDAKLLLGFKSSYIRRILQLISRVKNTQEFSCSVAELCDMLGTSLDEHVDFARFRRTALDRRLSEIIKESRSGPQFSDMTLSD